MNERLQEAIDFIQSEDIPSAKEILLELVKEKHPAADSWYMMMYCMRTTRQKVWCLEEALQIKPDHEEALKMLGILAPGHQMYRGEKFGLVREESSGEEKVNWMVSAGTVAAVLLLTAAVILIFS